MKNKRMLLVIVALVIVSLSCNFLSPNSQSHVANINSINQSITSLPVLDPEGTLPSPGAVQLRTLPTDGQDITGLTGEIEAAEQAALKAGAVYLKAQMPVSSIPLELASLPGASAFTISGQPAVGGKRLVSYNQPHVVQQAAGSLSPASVIGLISSMFTDMFSVPVALPTQKFTQTETEGDATTNMSMEIGKAGDGSSHFGMGLQSEGTTNGVSVKTDLSATIDGQRCPTAEGQVSFSIKARIGSEAGGVGTTQDLTTFVRAIVNDDAEIASSTFDVIQGTTQVKGGRQVYVETGETIKFGQGYTGVKESNWRVNQKTDNVTQDDVNNLEPVGFKAALELGVASLASAQSHWQNSGCTRIEAKSPETVQPGSTTAIPVTVLERFDGSVLSTKLETALTGDKSVDPKSLAKTPGTINYTASQEDGAAATITLTATSRRGRATLQLAANTGGQTAYRIVGGLDDWQTNTAVCDIMQPFTLTGSAGITMNLSGGLTGTYTYTGQMFNLNGTGTYTISLPDGAGKPGTMIGKGSGSAEGNTNTGTEQYRLTPIDPAAGCSQ